MRLITVTAPKEKRDQIMDLVFLNGIEKLSVNEVEICDKQRKYVKTDKISLETNVPKGKKFIEDLMAETFYDPKIININSREPKSIAAINLPKEETMPMPTPTLEVYEELWQFCQITRSLVLRVFFAAIITSFGLVENYIPLIIAGLLFLPYHHHLIGMALASKLREWHLFKQAFLAFVLSTLIICGAGISVGLISGEGIEFTKWKETSTFISFLISIVIGLAAGIAACDDAGRRELIGLAATAHLSIYPMWFGVKMISGFEATDEPSHFLLVFLMDAATICIASLFGYIIMQMKGNGIKSFIAGLK